LAAAGEAAWTDPEGVHGEIVDEILEDGTPMEDPSDAVWEEMERQVGPEWERRGWPQAPEGETPELGSEMRGLTADEAFQQHHAARRIDPKQGEFPGMGGWREQLEAAREKVAPRTPEEQAAWERALRERSRSPRPVVEPPPIPPPLNPMAAQSLMAAGPDEWEEGDYGSVPWWDSVPGMEDLPEFEIPDDEGFLESLFSGVGGFLGSGLRGQQQATLPYAQQAQAQLGAFENMSTEEKLAIVLTGLAALSAGTGVGGPLVPPLLGGSALLTAVG